MRPRRLRPRWLLPSEVNLALVSGGTSHREIAASLKAGIEQVSKIIAFRCCVYIRASEFIV